MWAQVYATVAPLTYKEKAACFRLTALEHDELAKRNGEFEKPLKAEEECRDLIATAKEEGRVFQRMTVSAWRSEHLQTLQRYSVKQIGAALIHMGLERKSVRLPGDKYPSYTYELPTAEALPAAIRRVK